MDGDAPFQRAVVGPGEQRTSSWQLPPRFAEEERDDGGRGNPPLGIESMRRGISPRIAAALVEGVSRIVLESPASWAEFHREVETLRRDYVFRGQRKASPDWPLRSWFDRGVNELDDAKRRGVIAELLACFRREMLAAHPGVDVPKGDAQTLVLGAHYGLITPILDWTHSPDVAAFFALAASGEREVNRYVYALRVPTMRRLLEKRKRRGTVLSSDRSVEFLDDQHWDVPRLRAQRGLHSLALHGDDIERNVSVVARKRPGLALLVQFALPAEDRDVCLSELSERAIDRPHLMVPMRSGVDLSDVVGRCNEALLAQRGH